MFTKRPERDAAEETAVDHGSEMVSRLAERPAAYTKSAGPCILNEDLQITGNVVSKGEIQIDGEIQGDVKCGLLLLGEKSQIVGTVVADDVVVRGRVIGSIRGLRVTLQAQSHVEGDIFHQSLAIEQGAYFEGKSRRADDPLGGAKPMQPQVPEAPKLEPAERPTMVAEKVRLEPRATSFEQRAERPSETRTFTTPVQPRAAE